MILSDVKQYLVKHQRAPLGDLCNHFDIEADAMRGMLEQWLRKGRVQKFTGEASCDKACCKCDPAVMEIYEWRP